MVFTTREDTTLCCTEEAARVLQKCGATVTSCLPSGTRLAPGMTFLVAEGSARSLHAGWKVSLNLLEYASGIASRTRLKRSMSLSAIQVIIHAPPDSIWLKIHNAWLQKGQRHRCPFTPPYPPCVGLIVKHKSAEVKAATPNNLYFQHHKINLKNV